MADSEYPFVIRVMLGNENVLDIPITVHYTRNLLQNPGFELEDEDLTPAGWSIGRSGQWVQDEVYSGQYAATLFADNKNTWNVMHSRGFIAVKPGKTYRLGGWIKLAEGGNVDIGIRQLDENNQTISYTWETIEGQSDWAYYEMEITPAENTVSIQATSLMRHQ